MQFTAAQIALIVNGFVEGNSLQVVKSFGKIELAAEGDLSFLANPKYEDFLYSTKASVVLINQSFLLKQPVNCTLIRVADAYSAFAILLSKYQELKQQQLVGIHQPCSIDSSAILGNDLYVAPFVTIGSKTVIGNKSKLHAGVAIGSNVTIGENVLIHAGVVVYDDCIIGNNVVIHAGTVIGSDGFGFAPLADGSYKKIPQLGNVVIKDNVEIGANCTIDRATLGSTIIHEGAKLDNLIQVAHNVEIGEHTVIAAQTGVSGSSKVGKYAMIGGQTGIAGHLSIADGTKVNGQSGITKSIKTPKTSVNGTPAFDYTASLRSQIIYKNLPDLEKRVRQLEQIINQLSTNQNQ